MQQNTDFLNALNIQDLSSPCSTGLECFGNTADTYTSYSPVDGKTIGQVGKATESDYEKLIQTAEAAKAEWAAMPAPKRGEIVRQIGNALLDRIHAFKGRNKFTCTINRDVQAPARHLVDTLGKQFAVRTKARRPFRPGHNHAPVDGFIGFDDGRCGSGGGKCTCGNACTAQKRATFHCGAPSIGKILRKTFTKIIS